MQGINLNQEPQNARIPSSVINIFAQSLYAQLEVLAIEANSSLEMFENQEYIQLKTCLQAHIQQMQHALNNIELLGMLEQGKA